MKTKFIAALAFLLMVVATLPTYAQNGSNKERLEELERKLEKAKDHMEQTTLDSPALLQAYSQIATAQNIVSTNPLLAAQLASNALAVLVQYRVVSEGVYSMLSEFIAEAIQAYRHPITTLIQSAKPLF